MPRFSKRSKEKLKTCDERLQLIFNIVIQIMDITILEGHRGEAAQEKAFAEGKSKAKWGQSDHNNNPSLAVDVAPYPIDWNDIKRFHMLAGIVQAVAFYEGIDVRWGGNFNSFFDGPHFYLED